MIVKTSIKNSGIRFLSLEARFAFVKLKQAFDITSISHFVIWNVTLRLK